MISFENPLESSVGVVVEDGGSTPLQVVFYNKALAKILGREPKNLAELDTIVTEDFIVNPQLDQNLSLQHVAQSRYSGAFLE